MARKPWRITGGNQAPRRSRCSFEARIESVPVVKKLTVEPVAIRERLGADASLVLVTLVWGSTFVVVKNAIDVIEPLSLVALRFLLASIVLLGS